jgi:GAF domain-containing protein
MSGTNTQQPGEIAIEIAPPLDTSGADDKLADRVDALLRRTSLIARWLTGAEQAALKLWIDDEATRVWKYYSLSDKYESFRDFRVNARGVGLHGMTIPPGEAVRLTQDEVASHPLWRNFGPAAAEHPPMRGWLASSVSSEDGRIYGLLQLSDKSQGRDFDADDEQHITELAALVGDALDALRTALSISQQAQRDA